jgi:hypothetical protein
LLSDLQKEMTKFCYDLYSEREIDWALWRKNTNNMYSTSASSS